MTETVGSALRHIRKGRGESIVAVAKATHTSPASFTKWENDQTVPSERSIRKLADYYDMAPTSLLALAYPTKYATPTEQLSLAGKTLIRAEDLFSSDTVLTYDGHALPDDRKQLIAAFTAGLFLRSKQSN